MNETLGAGAEKSAQTAINRVVDVPDSAVAPLSLVSPGILAL